MSSVVCLVEALADTSEHAPIPVESYSTGGMSADQSFLNWMARGWPSVAALFDVAPIGPFDTRTDQVRLDDLLVQFSWGTARRFTRTSARIADGADILAVNMSFADGTLMTINGRTRGVSAGDIVLVDMSQPSTFQLVEGDSIQLAVPRAVAEAHLGAVAALHGQVIPAARASLLVQHLKCIRSELPSFTARNSWRLGRTIMDLLSVATDRERSVVIAGTDAFLPTPDIITATIEAHLGNPGLSVRWLMKHFSLPRTSLYRAFRTNGGIEAYIRERRLQRVYASLSDPLEDTPIGVLATKWGFCDSSHLSRHFRLAYAIGPASYRALCRAGRSQNGDIKVT